MGLHSATAHVTAAPTVHPYHCSLLFRWKEHIYNILLLILPGVLDSSLLGIDYDVGYALHASASDTVMSGRVV